MFTSLVKVGPSSGRSGPTPTVNGGLAPRRFVPWGLMGSRAKNCPTPARSTQRCLPSTSHAAPRRGAIRCLFSGTKLFHLEYTPPAKPWAAHPFGAPLASTMPLHGDVAAGLPLLSTRFGSYAHAAKLATGV